MEGVKRHVLTLMAHLNAHVIQDTRWLLTTWAVMVKLFQYCGSIIIDNIQSGLNWFIALAIDHDKYPWICLVPKPIYTYFATIVTKLYL